MALEEDRVIINNIKTGDKKAFDSLFCKYYAALCYYAEKILRRQDLAEGIVQELFIRLWENKNAFQVESGIKPYLYSSVKNRCIDEIRKQQVRDNYLKEKQQDPEDLLVEKEDKEMQAERLRAVKKAINELPEQRKKIFKMSRLLGLKYNEIAETLDISPKTVENQMGFALKQLREKLNPKK
jgi:RNA polymerase sigma-70 factor (ECF subfamily)